MKKLITILAISLCLLSCKKEQEVNPELKVEYKITCDSCTVEIGTDPKVRKFDVVGFLVFQTIEYTPSTKIKVIGDSQIKTEIRLNGNTIFSKINHNGQFTYNVKLHEKG